MSSQRGVWLGVGRYLVRGLVSDQRGVSGQRGEEDRSPRDGYYHGR